MRPSVSEGRVLGRVNPEGTRREAGRPKDGAEGSPRSRFFVGSLLRMTRSSCHPERERRICFSIHNWGAVPTPLFIATPRSIPAPTRPSPVQHGSTLNKKLGAVTITHHFLGLDGGRKTDNIGVREILCTSFRQNTPLAGQAWEVR